MLNSVSKKIFTEIIALSEQNLSTNKVPIAAIIFDYKNQKIVSKAVNTDSPIGHAEMEAIRDALEKKNTTRLDDCDIYVSIEPCLMCAGASYWAQLNKIVFGASDEKRGFQNKAGLVLHPKTECVKGVMAEECAQLLTDFFASKRELK